MVELPSGTVTFLLTDVEGSTALWEQAPETMRAALARHDALFEEAVAAHGGIHIRPRGEGDSRFAVFASAPDAVAAAVAIQRALTAEGWPTPRPSRPGRRGEAHSGLGVAFAVTAIAGRPRRPVQDCFPVKSQWATLFEEFESFLVSACKTTDETNWRSIGGQLTR
jgi:class 3 adenylate cyclase